MKNNKQARNLAILILALSLVASSIVFIGPYLTGLAAGGIPGPPGGSPPGGGGGGATTTTTTGGGGVGMQRVIGIYPQFPAGEDTIKNGDYNLSVKITHCRSSTTTATVKAISDLFGEIILDSKGGGIYESKISLRNIKKGKYKILYKARDVDEEEGAIFVNVNPELKIETDFNDKYNLGEATELNKGETIEFKGTIKDYKDEPQPEINIIITGYSQGIVLGKRLSSDSQGSFLDSYNIGYADPRGQWDITILANDSYGNSGVFESGIMVKEKGASYFVLNFLSPLIESEFKRGNVMQIAVELREKGLLVENATVMFFSINGERFTLREVDKGIYLIDYFIKHDYPLGRIRLKVDAAKKSGEALKVGGDSIPISILPTEINFDLASPSTDVAYTLSRLKYLIKLTYANGESVKGANVNVDLSNGKGLRLLEVQEGTYSGEYLVSLEEVGTLTSEITVDDANGNRGNFKVVSYIRPRSLIGNKLALFYEDIFLKFWWAFIIALLLLSVYLTPKFKHKYLTVSLASVLKKQKTTRSMQVEAEKNYYTVGDINKEEFKHLMQGYKKESFDLKEKEKDLREKLRKPKQSKKR